MLKSYDNLQKGVLQKAGVLLILLLEEVWNLKKPILNRNVIEKYTGFKAIFVQERITW